MDKEALSERFWNNMNDILQQELSNNPEYCALIQRKIAAESALQELVSEDAWKHYLMLDELCIELENTKLEAMYLAGAADYEKQLSKSKS